MELSVRNIDGHLLTEKKGRQFLKSVGSCIENRLDHLRIIPYIPYFDLKYNSQNNVKGSLTVLSSLLFTQICVQEFGMREPQVRAPNSVGTVTTEWGDARNILDSKFVSDSVTERRLRKCEIHGQLHTLICLAILLP
jgi:hypothetical protein